MSWEDLGIQDPGLKWHGCYQDWKTNNLGKLFDVTIEEIEDYQNDIDEMQELGLWLGQLGDFKDWLDFIEATLEEASNSTVNFRSKLMKVRCELIRFRRKFDNFTIDWLGS